jgi:O-acetyl-ADP-ribose deacetylase (regulator of RNase III)
MPLEIIRNDITKMAVDAIVNAANTSLQMGSGVCGAIFAAAGAEMLQAECNSIGMCKVGEAVITNGYNLPAPYIIHTAGPIWRGGNSGEAKLLHNCYISVLTLAWQNECKSIAFPLISSGIYGYPKDQALQIAIAAIGEFILNHEMTVYLVVFDKKSFVLSQKLFSAIKKYIDDNYVDEHLFEARRNKIWHDELQLSEIEDIGTISEARDWIPATEPLNKRSLEERLSRLDESFPQMLLRLIDEKGMTDVDAYKRANIDRKLFSKIRSVKEYHPSKATAIAFAIALRLNLNETHDLLSKAGYTLSHSNKFDVIIEYFITEANYNIHEINEVLFAFDQVLLGA